MLILIIFYALAVFALYSSDLCFSNISLLAPRVVS